MKPFLRVSVALLACGSFSACAHAGTSPGDDCVSRYEPVAEAATWQGLRDAMVAGDERGRVASLRTQDRGEDVGVGDEDAVRVVDLVGRNGRRLAQVEVWRTDGRWHAGEWSQCID